MPNKSYFRCNVCNDIHFGIAGPGICPTCQVENAYIEIEKHEAMGIMNLG
jgi:rubrerythrin